MAAGFSVVAPEELAALTEDETATDDAPAETTAGAVAEAIAEAIAATEAAPEPVTEQARVPPMPRPENLSRPASALAEAASPAPEEAPAPETALAMASEATDAATAETEMLWIGSAETILGDPLSAGEPIELATPLEDGPDPDSATEMAQVLPARLTVAPEKPAAPAANPGIILTSRDMDARDSAERQAIAAVVEAHVEQSDSAGRVISLSTSDTGRLWGVSLGQFNSRAAAERSLITVKMAEAAALGNGVSRIRQTSGRFEASFAGLTQSEAERAYLRLSARAMDCAVAHP